MSKALRCDKCGKTFSPILIGATEVFTTIPELYFQNKLDVQKKTCADRKTDLNFCPTCTEEFLKFMEDFKHETSYLSGCIPANPDASSKLQFTNCVRGRYKYEGASRNSDCEATEWTDDTQ